MGSLTSRPKAAKTVSPQVVYVPASNPAPAPATPTPDTGTDKSTDTGTESREEQSQKQREDNLLRRDRGRGGTVQTGFRGLLSALDNSQKKKTLLGQ